MIDPRLEALDFERHDVELQWIESAAGSDRPEASPSLRPAIGEKEEARQFLEAERLTREAAQRAASRDRSLEFGARRHRRELAALHQGVDLVGLLDRPLGGV